MQQLSVAEQPDARKLVEDILKFLGALRRGWRLIALCTVGTLALAAIYLLAVDKPLYQAMAHLLVLQHGGRPIAIDNGATNHSALLQSVDGYSNSLATHMMILRSPAVVGRALKEVDRSEKDPSYERVESVLKKLSVKRPDEEARVLEITYRSESYDEAGQVLNEVIKSYDQFLKENYQQNTKEVLELINKARADMQVELKQLENDYLQFRKEKAGGATVGEGRSFIARRLDQWDQTINKAVIRSIQLKSQLELGRKLAENGADVGSIALGLNQLGGLGGEVAASPVLLERGGVPGEPLARLEAELREAESRRETVELLVEHLRAQLASAVPPQGTDSEETVRAFYAEPDVAALHEQLSDARANYDAFKRRSRRVSDPSVVEVARQVKQLEAELATLWRQRKSSLATRLGGAGSAQLLKAQSELVALRAIESALRERLDRVKAERVGSLRQELEGLVKQHGPKHPKVDEALGQIARIEAKTGDASTNPMQHQTRALLASIEQGLKSVGEIRQEIERRFNQDLTESKKAEVDTLEEMNLRNQLERQRALFFSVVDQLKQAQLVSDFGTVTAQRLNLAVIPTRTPVVLILLAALIVGFGLGAAAVYVVDLVDARLHSVPEIRQLLGLRVLGQIIQLPRERPSVETVGILCHAEPQSILAESYKSIRTGIDLLRRNWHGQVILVTSSQSGEGKSMTSSNLAISLAQSGRKVLLVDADLRHPSLHHIYPIHCEKGLTQVLAERQPLDRTVQSTPIENLDLLAAGPGAPNPAELLASQRLVTFVEETRQAYDMVVIDSSPLLAVTDASLIAAVSDGIVLVVRESLTRRHDAEQTIELLGTLGTQVLGVVVNGVKPARLGYRYGYPNGSNGRRSERGVEVPADDEPPEPASDTAGLPVLTTDRDAHDQPGISGDPMS
jgi:capsular exopolysaccharide synthesis family protein